MVDLTNLFYRINALGITAKRVSDDTGISTGNISDWKSGRSMPTALKLVILADYLDCSVDYLLGRTDNPEVNKWNEVITIQKTANVSGYCPVLDDECCIQITYLDASTLYSQEFVKDSFRCKHSIHIGCSLPDCPIFESAPDAL